MQATNITNEATSRDNNTDLKMNYDALRLWLETILSSEYFDNFVLSGYESMEFIKEIQNELELQEIGINSKTERIHILVEIEKLRMISIQQEKMRWMNLRLWITITNICNLRVKHRMNKLIM